MNNSYYFKDLTESTEAHMGRIITDIINVLQRIFGSTSQEVLDLISTNMKYWVIAVG